MKNKRSSGLSVRRRRDRHAKRPVKSGNSAPGLPAAAHGSAIYPSAQVSASVRRVCGWKGIGFKDALSWKIATLRYKSAPKKLFLGDTCHKMRLCGL